jgi:RNA-directed DNA polymerase
MQIDDAKRRAIAPVTELDDRMSSTALTGPEVGTAANGQTKAEALRQMDAVVERNDLWRGYERVMRNR